MKLVAVGEIENLPNGMRLQEFADGSFMLAKDGFSLSFSLKRGAEIGTLDAAIAKLEQLLEGQPKEPSRESAEPTTAELEKALDCLMLEEGTWRSKVQSRLHIAQALAETRKSTEILKGWIERNVPERLHEALDYHEREMSNDGL